MEKVKQRILYTALGAVSGLTGVAVVARCTGGACPTCWGCVVPGIGIALMTLIGRKKGGKRDYGMAQKRR